MLHSMRISLAIVRAAAWLVPRGRREEWLAEWHAELWEVCRAYGVAWKSDDPHGQAEVTAFCLGAFEDAFTLRMHAMEAVAAYRLQVGSPWRTVMMLAALLVASVLLCLASPAAREAAWGHSRLATDEVVLISSEGTFGVEAPTVRFADYELWKADDSRYLRGLAFYRPDVAEVRIEGEQPRRMRAGYASQSLMNILAPTLSVSRMEVGTHSDVPVALLSQEVWRRKFHADPRLIGKTFLVGEELVTVGGIASREWWPMPGAVDIVLLEPDAELARSSSSASGFVLAPAIRPALRFEKVDRPFVELETASGKGARFECLTLEQRRQNPRDLFLFSLLLACLALPALTPLPLGDYPEALHTATVGMKVRRWSFLMLKFGCIFPTSFLAPIWLACRLGGAGTTAAAYLQIAVAFLIMLFGFRWALQDQRKRCPACLRLLSHPALVGHASHSFLAWSGTELLCVRGHGFLHIPEHPTSWFSTQRWVAVDASWSGLFSEVQAATGP